MKKFYVYIHVCPNGKRYVGCTTRVKPEYRWARGNGYRYNKHFYSAILKHGWSNFRHEVFEVDSEEEMYRKEIELISFYHSNDPEYGYNNSTGGERIALGCKHSEESRKKQSEAQKKVHADPEYRKRISETLKERCSDPEVRRKMAEAQKKVHSDPEYRKRISETSKKRASDPEYRKKLSETQKKRCLDPEVRKRMAEVCKERWSDPEYRKRISEAVKERCSDPEVRRKRSEIQKKVHADPEYRKRISETLKGKSRSKETRKRIASAKKGKPLPRVKIKLQDGTIVEVTKQTLTRWYVNKCKKFEYLSY